MHMRFVSWFSLGILMSSLATAEESKQLSVQRIFGDDEFATKSGVGKWLPDSSGYLQEQDDPDGNGKQIVSINVLSGESSVLVSAADLTPKGSSSALAIDGYQFTEDRSRVLIYTDSKRVWRRNTRGDYWVLDRSGRQLRKLGGDGAPSSMMFAKFSPNGKKVAYVRDRNIYVEDLIQESITQITQTNGDNIINGTSDWVYEEELGVRDGFRWSPDGELIAYWQLDTSQVKRFPLINNTDSLYPRIQWFAYPKVGQTNAACKICVSDMNGLIRSVYAPVDSRNHYVARMEWLDNSRNLILQKLNRYQNENRVVLVRAESGAHHTILTEKDDAWVDVHDEMFWNSRNFTWISERNGWRHIYLGTADERDFIRDHSGVVSFQAADLTHIQVGEMDVLRLHEPIPAFNCLYFDASPNDASQQYLFRIQKDGSGLQRISPEGQPGTHKYSISPDGQFAFHTYSRKDMPPVTRLISLPDHQRIRDIETNEAVKEKLAELEIGTTQFFQIEINDNVSLDAYCIQPPTMEAGKKYPLVVYVYGEPAGQTVLDRWSGNGHLWHHLLAQQGYVVMSFDNRGTPAPKGRAWRKSVYKKVGILAPQDQAAAVRAAIAKFDFIDQDRIGVWGWSGGGSMTLNAMFKFPDLYKTGISIAPVPNMRYYDTIYQERYMALPEDNVDGYRDGSPINFAKGLKGNLLLVHGTGDDNCHYQTMEMLINELIFHNKRFTMMAYPNRTHSIREGKNTTLHLRQLMTDYLNNNLPCGPK